MVESMSVRRARKALEAACTEPRAGESDMQTLLRVAEPFLDLLGERLRTIDAALADVQARLAALEAVHDSR